MNQKTILLWIVAIAGVGCLIVGVYLVFRPETKQTEVTSTPTSETGEPKTPNGCKEIARGEISVKEPFTNIGSFKGKILIQMWGKATIDGTQAPFTPAGWRNGVHAADFFPLPHGTLFGAVMKANGKVSWVGDSNDFDFPSNTTVFLGPNDANGTKDLGLSDNSGFWQYKVCAKS